MPTSPVPTTEATPPQSGFVPANRAPELIAKQRELNRAKKPAFIPNAIEQQSEETRLYIFNVGPKHHEGNGASYGTMMIPPCLSADVDAPKSYRGKPGEYSEPLMVPGLPHEYYNKEGNTLDVQFHGDGDITDPGYDFACQVIGGFHSGWPVTTANWEGKFLPQSGSLERFGVGISRTWPPAKADVELARKKLHFEYGRLVQEGNEAHALGKFASISSEDHFVAARALGKTSTECRWLEFSAEAPSEAKATKACPECGEEILAVAKKCRYCGSAISVK